jgi:hypothetical protein
MSVVADPEGSRVTVLTEFTLTGRVAQFGRGVIEDVSKRMVRTVAECIQANLQQTGPSEPAAQPQPEVASESAPDAEAPTPLPTPPSSNIAPATAPPINAASLMFSVLGGYVTDPGFWDAGIKVLDRMVTEVERLTERLDSLVVRSAQVDR